MSREIKYRAWDGTKMQTVASVDWAWETSGPVEVLRAVSGTFVDGSPLRFWVEHANKPILMQFTGIVDKNGAEIYEGDIVQSSDLWADSEGVHTYEPVLVKLLTENVDYAHWNVPIDEGVEVIGNIYDDFDLLDETT